MTLLNLIHPWILVIFTLLSNAIADPRCSEGAENVTQPIAIHFSVDTIVASYAYSDTNITTLVALRAQSPNYTDLEDYGRHVWLLRYEHWRQFLVTSSEESAAKFGDKRFDTGFDSEDLKQGFIKAINTIRQIAFEYSQINITSAIIIHPPFFNETIQRVLLDAASEAGVHLEEPFSPAITLKTAVDAYQDSPEITPEFQRISHIYTSLTEEFKGGRFHPDTKKTTDTGKGLLLIDYGHTYFDIHITAGKCTCKCDFKTDVMGTYWLWTRLTDMVISKYDDEHFRQEQSYHGLLSAVGMAREYIRVHCNSANNNITDNMQPVVEEEFYCEEWPLDLPDDWWSEGEKRNLTLSREDVQSAENEYVEIIADFLVEAMDRQLSHNHDPDISNDLEDYSVVIIGSYDSGDLIKRAVRRGFGERMDITGGDLSAITIPSKGGARFAFAIRETAANLLEAVCQLPWYMKEHNEL